MEESQVLGFWGELRKKQEKKCFHSIPEIQLKCLGNKGFQRFRKDTHKTTPPENLG